MLTFIFRLIFVAAVILLGIAGPNNVGRVLAMDALPKQGDLLHIRLACAVMSVLWGLFTLLWINVFAM